MSEGKQNMTEESMEDRTDGDGLERQKALFDNAKAVTHMKSMMLRVQNADARSRSGLPPGGDLPRGTAPSQRAVRRGNGQYKSAGRGKLFRIARTHYFTRPPWKKTITIAPPPAPEVGTAAHTKVEENA